MHFTCISYPLPLLVWHKTLEDIKIINTEPKAFSSMDNHAPRQYVLLIRYLDCQYWTKLFTTKYLSISCLAKTRWWLLDGLLPGLPSRLVKIQCHGSRAPPWWRCGGWWRWSWRLMILLTVRVFLSFYSLSEDGFAFWVIPAPDMAFVPSQILFSFMKQSDRGWYGHTGS
jgi:hypothetical protein